MPKWMGESAGSFNPTQRITESQGMWNVGEIEIIFSREDSIDGLSKPTIQMAQYMLTRY